MCAPLHLEVSDKASKTTLIVTYLNIGRLYLFLSDNFESGTIVGIFACAIAFLFVPASYICDSHPPLIVLRKLRSRKIVQLAPVTEAGWEAGPCDPRAISSTKWHFPAFEKYAEKPGVEQTRWGLKGPGQANGLETKTA